MNTKTEPAKGTVIETLADFRYRVEIESGETIMCYLGGKMKFNRINVLVGDKVQIILDPYKGKATNRIVRRL